MTLTDRVAIMYVFFAYGHICKALVNERRLCIRSLLCLRSNLLCCACSLRMTLLGQIGIAKMNEHRKMTRLVSRSQAKQRIVKLVAAM